MRRGTPHSMSRLSSSEMMSKGTWGQNIKTDFSTRSCGQPVPVCVAHMQLQGPKGAKTEAPKGLRERNVICPYIVSEMI